MSSPRVLVALLALVAVTCMGAEAAVTCSDVVRDLMPCTSYVMSGGAVPESCCSGIKTLNDEAKSTSDRQSVCSCLKSAIGSFSYNSNTVGRAAALPSKCNVNIPYKINPSTDCASVK